jgi:flavodoxin
LKKAIIIYWSHSGNTERAAQAIEAGLIEGGMQTSLMKVKDAEAIDYFDYDLVCIGAPSYAWHVPKPVEDFLKKKHTFYNKEDKIKLSCPRVPGKNVLVFCTYSGPHTGIAEAIPAGKFMGQFFDHIGFTVIDEWYILSEFIGSLDNSTLGRLGDIRGLPTVEELKEIENKAKKLATIL